MTSISFSKINSDDIDLGEKTFDPFSKQTESNFEKPNEIGHFSINENKKIFFDKSQLKYLIAGLPMENVNYNLNAEYLLNMMHQYVTVNKLFQLLHWIIYKNVQLDVDFVTVRGTLTRIMCTPYTAGYYRNKWEICASKYRGTIYVSAVDTSDDLIESISPQLLRYQSWGHKFEQYVTTNKNDDYPTLRPFNNHEEYCIVLKNNLNDHSLLYQAEIDAAQPYSTATDTSRYVELKTSRIITGISELSYFISHKLVLWWAQSFLTGISLILCGRRTNEGIVKSLEVYKVAEIPAKAYGHWTPESCLNFCDKFLNILKKTVIEDNHNLTYKFTYNGEGTVYCKKLICPEKKYKIIPDWYVKAMEKYGR